MFYFQFRRWPDIKSYNVMLLKQYLLIQKKLSQRSKQAVTFLLFLFRYLKF